MAPAHILRALKRRGCCLLAMLMLAALASGCATNFDDVARLPSRTIEHGAKTVTFLLVTWSTGRIIPILVLYK